MLTAGDGEARAPWEWHVWPESAAWGRQGQAPCGWATRLLSDAPPNPPGVSLPWHLPLGLTHTDECSPLNCDLAPEAGPSLSLTLSSVNAIY